MFITFEGPEGSGKSTQARALAKCLESRGEPVLLTKEPGGDTPTCKEIRKILVTERYGPSRLAELFLFMADRADHVARVIRPALSDGVTVICDRYGDSTRAYQCFARGISRQLVERLHGAAAQGVEPDLTFLLNVPVEEGLKRAKSRNTETQNGEGRFESEELAFHLKLYDGYMQLYREYPRRIEVIDGMRGEHDVLREVLAAYEVRKEQLDKVCGSRGEAV